MAQIWALGGGKGGVGKTFVTANLATQLAINNYKVVVIDLDLGGANIHTCLGCSPPKNSLSDFVNKRFHSFGEIISPTNIRNLSLISGANDALTIGNLKYSQKIKIISAIKKLEADYILLDLGAGTTFNTLDFYLHADIGLLIVLPEPTSIENAYRFIKSTFFRMLRMCDDIPRVKELIDEATQNKNYSGIKSPAELVRKIAAIDPEVGEVIRYRLGCFKPRLIMNQVRNANDIDIGFSMQTVCRHYFGVEMGYVGYLEYDHTVWQSVRRKKVLSLDTPNSPLVSHFQNITKRLKGYPPVKQELRV